jgi:hypothetical protein
MEVGDAIAPELAPTADRTTLFSTGRRALIDQLWSAIEALPDPEPQPDPKGGYSRTIRDL